MPHLLYVDDDLDCWAEIQRQLSGHFQLEIAFNGWDGFANTVLHKPDLVLLNLDLPVMDGIELVRLVRTESDCASLTLLGFVRAPLSEQVRSAARKVGFTQLIDYPFGPDLLAQLTALLPAKPD